MRRDFSAVKPLPCRRFRLCTENLTGMLESLTEMRVALAQARQDLARSQQLCAHLTDALQQALSQLPPGEVADLLRDSLATLDALADASEHPNGDAGAALARLAEASLQAGDREAALQTLEAASQAAAQQGDRSLQTNCAVSRAMLLWETGRADTALAVASEALQWAREEGALRHLETSTEVGRLQYLTDHQVLAEGTLLSAFSQFQRWKAYWHAARAALFLADLYGSWRPAESLGWLEHALDLSQSYQLSELFVAEWAVAGPLLVPLLTTRHREQIRAVLEQVGPAVLKLWPDPESVPADVRELPSMRPAEGVLRIVMLGDFAVFQGPARIADSAWQGRKVKNLLAVLLQHRPRMLSTDELIELFWPDAAPEKGRHSLYMTIYRARRALEPEGSGKSQRYIRQHAESYGFNVDTPHRIDVDGFETRAREGRKARASGDPGSALASLVEAARLYGGDYLQNAAYEEWAAEPREALRRQYQDVLTAVAELHLEDHHPDMAETYARKLLASDGTREESYRLLMHVLAQRGLRDEVQRLYRTCCEVLDREIGVAPMPETVRVYESLL